MNNFQKFLSTKPTDFITTNDLAKRYDISLGRVQRYAYILKIQKDSSGIYVFDKKGLERFENFIKVITSP